MLASPALLVAQPKPLLGGVVQRAQQLPFPLVPRPRPDRANIDHGQHQQQSQPLGALHLTNKIKDRLGVGEVALEGGGGHQKMIAHQPCDGLGLRLVEPEARAERLRHFLAQHAVVALPPFGDIVQQHRDIQQSPRPQLAEQGGRQRMIFGQFAALDFREQANRADRMFVDRIMVIHVELHLRDDPPEVGNEPPEHPRLVHPAKHQIRVGKAGQHLEEQGVGRGIVAHLVNGPRIAGRGAHRLGVDLEALARGQRKQLDQPHRLGGKEALIGDRQPPAIEAETVQFGRTAAESGQRETAPLDAHLLVELGEEDPGQVADRLGLQEIELHEPLDRRFARPLGIMQRPCDGRLVVEAQPIFASCRGEVEVAANRPEEALGALEPAKLLRAQQPRLDHIHGPLDPEQMVGDPV